LHYFVTIGAASTIAPPNVKTIVPNPVIAVMDIIQPIPVTNARMPEAQANVRLSNPRTPSVSEIGAPTIARRPNIIASEFDTRPAASIKSTMPK